MPLLVNGHRVPDTEIEQLADQILRENAPGVGSGSNRELVRFRALQAARKHIVDGILLEDAVGASDVQVSMAQVKDAWRNFFRRYGGEKRYAKRRGLSKKELQRIKERLRARLRREVFLESVVFTNADPSADEIEDYFNHHRAEFSVPEEARAAHIVLHLNGQQDRETARARIEEARERLQGGETFAAVADSCSDCSGNGGDIGWFKRGDMVEAFDDVVFSMDPGGVSDIFETPFGFHLAQVLERRPARVRPLEEVSEQIRHRLVDDRHHQAMERFLLNLRQRATIEER